VKRTFLGVVASAAFAVTPALAADVVVYEEPPIIVEPFSWTGFYVGINAGFGGGTFDHPFDIWLERGVEGQEFIEELANGSLDITSSGFLAGVQVGYNHQINNLILGVEADIQWADIEGELSGDINGDGGSLDFELGTQVEWFGTIRARLGYAATERLMVYATGGAAYGRVESYYDFNFSGGGGGGGSFSDSISDTNWGWTIGGGFEYAVNDRWSLKTEYLYTDLGESDLLSNVFPITDGIGIGVDIDSDVAFHTVRAGLNYHF
jgi:outer membrane immunogenic protein